jgi:hypothetical protein
VQLFRHQIAMLAELFEKLVEVALVGRQVKSLR